MSRCPACPCLFLPIAGSGPLRSRILFLGERPGDRENKRGEVFCGPTGQELDETYLRLAGLHRHEVRIENCVRCWAVGNRSPSDKEVDSCARHWLPGVLQECQPEILVLMGGRACRIADRRLKIDTVHGMPYYGSILGGLWEGMIWPSYHPALGMHDTSKMSNLLEDFSRMGEWLRGDWEPPNALSEAKDYRLVRTVPEFVSYARSAPLGGESAIDTESHGKTRWSMQISRREHSGVMVLCEDGAVVEEFHQFCAESARAGGVFIFHHCVHDLDELSRSGVELPIGQVRDTMQESFHMGSLPQGLKPLAYRLLGVEMRSWEDVVWPASVEAVQRWMEEAHSLASEHLTVIKETVQKTLMCAACGHKAHKKACKVEGHGDSEQCGCEEYDPALATPRVKREVMGGAVEAGMKHILTYSAKNEDYNPWDSLEKFWVDGLRGKIPTPQQVEWLMKELGPVPILGIGNAELDDAVAYGCSDADHTLQVARGLEQLRRGKEWAIMEGDEDQ